MSDLILDAVRLAGEAAQEAYKAGHAEGYRQGFREGVAEAQKIVTKHLAPELKEIPLEPVIDEEAKEHEWMRGKPLSAVTGKLSEDEEQDLRDAGRGHLLP
jgi:hypothetical protein